MKNLSQLVTLKTALSELDADKCKRLESYLPRSIKEHLNSVPTLTKNPIFHPIDIDEVLTTVHVSWFIDLFKDINAHDRSLFFSTCTHEQKQDLNRHFNELKELSISPLLESFLKRKVFESLLDKKQMFLVPIQCLSDFSLNILIQAPSGQIEMLLLYLGLYDLCAELKKIIYNQQLKAIEEALDTKAKQFLRSLQSKSQPLQFSSLGLANWDGDKDKLLKMLQLRGLNRLAQALACGSNSLLWYVSRKLSVAQAKALYVFAKESKDPKISEALIKQVVDTFKEIQDKE